MKTITLFVGTPIPRPLPLSQNHLVVCRAPHSKAQNPLEPSFLPFLLFLLPNLNKESSYPPTFPLPSHSHVSLLAIRPTLCQVLNRFSFPPPSCRFRLRWDSLKSDLIEVLTCGLLSSRAELYDGPGNQRSGPGWIPLKCNPVEVLDL